MFTIGGNTVSLALLGTQELQAAYVGEQKVYPNSYIEHGFDYTEWVYDKSVRSRTATPWSRVVYPDGTTGPKEYGEPFIQSENATETVTGEWAYQWTVTGSSTRHRTVSYRWPDGAANDDEQVETGGIRRLAFANYAGDIPASGGSTTCNSISHDSWGEQPIEDNPVSGVELTIDNGFSVTANEDLVTISRGANTGGAVTGTLSGSKTGFESGSLAVTQSADAENGTAITYDNTCISYNNTVLVWQ